MARKKRIVVKIGTNTICGDELEPDPAYLESMADELVRLREEGHEVLIVSSGAIGSGMGRLGFTERVREVKLQQALAAVGQARLIQAWEQAFNRHGVHVGQLLLTYDALRDRESFLNMRNAVEELIELGVVPIVNENDTVSIEEIGTGRGFGDNDKLSAYVAQKARADLLIVLSDVDGLYTKPPGAPGAELVPVVEEITEEIEQMAGAGGSQVGRGGMASKLESARIATEAGIPMVIADGRTPGVVTRILDGEMVGTRFLPRGSGSEKKRWLRIARPEGRVIVDAGAVEALAEGAHLLPAGITGVEGTFPRGSVVEIVESERTVAKAITQLSAKEIELAKGLQSDEVRDRLDLDGSANVTRKNNIVMLDGADRGPRSG